MDPSKQTYLTVDQAAEYLQLSPAALRMRMHRGNIPDWCWKRIGKRRIRFYRAALDQWMELEKGKAA